MFLLAISTICLPQNIELFINLIILLFNASTWKQLHSNPFKVHTGHFYIILQGPFPLLKLSYRTWHEYNHVLFCTHQITSELWVPHQFGNFSAWTLLAKLWSHGSIRLANEHDHSNCIVFWHQNLIKTGSYSWSMGSKQKSICRFEWLL